MRKLTLLLGFVLLASAVGLAATLHLEVLEGLKFPYPITSMALIDLEGNGEKELVLGVLHSGIYVYGKDKAGYWQYRYSSDSYGLNIFDIQAMDIFKGSREGIIFRNAEGNIFVLVWDGRRFIVQWKKRATRVIKKLVVAKNEGRFQIFFCTIDNSIYLYEFDPDLYVYYPKGNYISLPWKITGISATRAKNSNHLFYIISTYDGQIRSFEDKDDMLLSVSTLRLNANVVNVVPVDDGIWGYSNNKAIFGLKIDEKGKMNVDLVNDYPNVVDFVHPLSTSDEFILIGQQMSTGGYPYSYIEVVKLEHGTFLNYLKTLARYEKKLSQVLAFIPLKDGGMIGCRDGRVLKVTFR